jgi:hypothetical protein
MGQHNIIIQGGLNTISGECNRCTIINGGGNVIHNKTNCHVIGDSTYPTVNNSFYVGCRGGIACESDIVAYSSSDQELKDDIEGIPNCLNKVMSLDAIEFDWNEKQEVYFGHDIGLIAQQVQKIAPEIVAEKSDGYLSVKYEKIVPILVEAIKEQQVQIEDIEKEIQEIKENGRS